jgi:hypothetical protein
MEENRIEGSDFLTRCGKNSNSPHMCLICGDTVSVFRTSERSNLKDVLIVYLRVLERGRVKFWYRIKKKTSK